MTRQPTIGITMVTARVPVDPPPRKLGGEDDDPCITLEIDRSGLRVWSDIDHSICGERYSFADRDPRMGYGRNDLPGIPHFDAVYRYLAEQCAANRSNPLGKFLAPAVEAMDAALVARSGSSVYFAATGDRIKIGWSRKVAARIAQLQTGNPEPVRLLATTPGGRTLERQLHERFAHARISGEWFAATPDLITHVAGLAKGCPDHATA